MHRDDKRSEDQASSLEDGKGACEEAARVQGGEPAGWCLRGELKKVSREGGSNQLSNRHR